MGKRLLGNEKNINLLLDCSGRKSLKEVAGKLSAAGKEEWQQLLDLAQEHDMAPLLYSRLKPFFTHYKIPPEVQEQLRSSYFETGARNTLFYSRLSEILEALSKADIPVIVLKGAYLAEKVYEDIALRPMQDIDLLLKKNDLDKGKNVLINLGYSPVKPIYTEFETTHHHHISELIKGSLAVELHWNISSPGYPFSIDIDQLWERAIEQDIAENIVLVLSPEDLLLHLCIHTSFPELYKATIRFLYDIRMVMEKFNDIFRWDMFLQTAFAWKAERCAFLTLRMAEDLFALKIPEKIMTKLQPKDFSPEIMELAYEQLFCRDFDNYDIPAPLAHAWKAEKLTDRVSLFFKRIFLSRDELATKYPAPPWSPRIFLYYPVRIKDLFFDYGKASLGLMKKDGTALNLAEHRRKEVELREWLGKDRNQF